MKLFPTGQCFDNALDFIGMMVGDDPTEIAQSPLVLVHAIVRYPEDLAQILPQFRHRVGERYAHGWVEDGDLFVWDAGLLEDGTFTWYCADKEEYYREMRVEKTTKYTVAEAYAMNLKHWNFGPWEPEYRELCRT